MPNIKSAKKRMRSSEKQRVGNMAVKTKVKTARRKTREALAAGSAEATVEAVRNYSSTLDKAVKRGVIKKNTAIRRKKRANEALRKLAE
ncbi:MAG: small subunit ribosomal protein [Verrucomicrobiota bacterium]|jgi:small subunit ribosomal protein S20|nr:small subunit ribosomal protein [Verrucomicrobiota bacterium]MDK2963124.1 small subunit ribosomal protein [Verrucomicrobiota bacterium]